MVSKRRGSVWQACRGDSEKILHKNSRGCKAVLDEAACPTGKLWSASARARQCSAAT